MAVSYMISLGALLGAKGNKSAISVPVFWSKPSSWPTMPLLMLSSLHRLSTVSLSQPGKRTRRVVLFSNKTGRSPRIDRCLRSFMTAAKSLRARAKSTARLDMVVVSLSEASSSHSKVFDDRGTLASGPTAVMVGDTLKSMKEPFACADDMSIICLASS